MAQVKNSIFSTISKKEEDGKLTFSVDIENLKDATKQLRDNNESLSLINQDILRIVLEEVLQAEMKEFLNAKKSERTDGRTGYRNGSYVRSLATSIGRLNITIPRDRNGEFVPSIFERYTRVEQAFCSTLIEMVLNGVSTREVTCITQLLCGTSFSASTVSNMVKKIQPEVDKFKARPIVGTHKFVHLDAMYIKVREDHRVVNKAVVIALGYNNDGRKTVLGYNIVDSESFSDYQDFLLYLKDKGLKSPELFISDACPAIKRAIRDVYPKVQWQHCGAHLFRNTLLVTPRKIKKETAEMMKEFKAAFNEKMATSQANNIVDFLLKNRQQKAAKIFDSGFQTALTFMRFNRSLSKELFTNNALERVNGEVRKREKVIKIFPNVDSANRLIGALLIKIDEHFMTGNRNLEMIVELANT